jgi:hypothetical protein
VLDLGSYRRLGSILLPLDFVEVVSIPIAAMGGPALAAHIGG